MWSLASLVCSNGLRPEESGAQCITRVHYHASPITVAQFRPCDTDSYVLKDANPVGENIKYEGMFNNMR